MILEPEPRNTAAAVALAVLSSGPAQLLLVMPSDHLVADVAAFRAAVEAGVPLAEEGRLVAFGVTPDRPETGYGYIRRGEPLGGGAFEAAAFIEKPDAARARSFLDEGGYDWNAARAGPAAAFPDESRATACSALTDRRSSRSGWKDSPSSPREGPCSSCATARASGSRKRSTR
jgi:hypothetical protein